MNYQNHLYIIKIRMSSSSHVHSYHSVIYSSFFHLIMNELVNRKQKWQDKKEIGDTQNHSFEMVLLKNMVSRKMSVLVQNINKKQRNRDKRENKIRREVNIRIRDKR